MQLGISRDAAREYFAGRTVLEYGPGDVPGVALMMLANGARKVFLADRFPLIGDSDKNVAAVRELLHRMSPEERERALECLRVPAELRSGYRDDRLEYLVRDSGLSGLRAEADLVVSRAVLEHVDDLDATFADMERALKPGGVALHLVDLKSHGLHTRNPLDFLTWPEPLWRSMYSAKGVPNRWRVDRYREILSNGGLRIERLEPTVLAGERDVAEVRPRLAAPFRNLSDEDLSWLGFWLVCRK
ncbi:MAG: class I SAM-dependent methyltransferase [Burkholderiales bacterium]|nr:class I SAM-dependent methyltransferase [Burkholderiales bacterium]